MVFLLSHEPLTLSLEIHTMPKMDPPQLPMTMLQRFITPIVLERHLPEFVQAVGLVEAVEGGDVGVIAHVPVVVWEAGGGVGVFAEGDDVGAGDGEEVAGFVVLP